MTGLQKPRRYLLKSGIPCVKYRCIQCCIGTRMPLSGQDMKRIRMLGHDQHDFALRTGTEWRLKNLHGRCTFLHDSGCGIYSSRPEGCRIYPLVYDKSLRKPVLDSLCPFRSEFIIKDSDVQRLMRLLQELRAERKA